MALGYSSEVLIRLWGMINLMRSGFSREEILSKTGIGERVFQADIGRLRKYGVPIRYLRSEDQYKIDWPSEDCPIRLTPEELFYSFCIFSVLGEDNQQFFSTRQRFLTSILPESSPVHDCGPAYGISKNVNGLNSDWLVSLAEAIQTRHKIAFVYNKSNGEKQMREVHPYKLLHSPLSWYLSGWCVDANDWRIFKLARMNTPRVLGDTYAKRDYDLKKILGDAWWVRHDPTRLSNPYEVKVLFKGDAAMHIREYKFHSTQTFEKTVDGTLVSWKLSYLEEFASWLMQWLGQIEIQGPQALMEIISKRVNGSIDLE